jgi:hypothetical protein
MCSIERDPRRRDHTICTAVAPEAVFTVRTKATSAAYGPALVFKFRRIRTRKTAGRQPRQNPKREPSQVGLAHEPARARRLLSPSDPLADRFGGGDQPASAPSPLG